MGEIPTRHLPSMRLCMKELILTLVIIFIFMPLAVVVFAKSLFFFVNILGAGL